MLAQSKFQRLARGEAAELASAELPDFVRHCAEQTVLPDQLAAVAKQLYRQNPTTAAAFLQTLTNDFLPAAHYTCPLSNAAKAALYRYHSVLALGQAVRTPTQGDAETEVMGSVLKAEAVEGGSSCGVVRAVIHVLTGNASEGLKLARRLEGEAGAGTRRWTIAQLLQAQCHFSRRAYDKALECLTRCLTRKFWLPTSARLAMAYCYFYLNKFEMARACASRLLQLEPRHVGAYLCLAAVAERAENYRGYLENLEAAYRLDADHPLVLYLLAEHYLLRNELQTAQELCTRSEAALPRFTGLLNRREAVRDDSLELRSRLANLQGQIHHRRNNYPLALQFYSRAAERGLLWNDVALAQCLLQLRRPREALDCLEHTYKVYERERRDCRFLKDTYRIMAYAAQQCRGTRDPARDALYYYGEAAKFDKADAALKQQLAYLTATHLDSHRALHTLQELEKQQQTAQTQPSPETLLNIGILLMENHEPEQAEAKLRAVIQVIEQWNDLDLTQQRGFLLIAKYNYAICLHRANCNHRALAVLDEVLSLNRFHLNALLQKSLLLHTLGDRRSALVTLANARPVFQERISPLQLDKIAAMQAYLLCLQGNYHQAFPIITQLSNKRPDYIYFRVLEFAVRYGLEGHGEGSTALLRNGKQYFETVCAKDNAQLFCYMILAVVNAALRTLGDQGTNIFKKIQVNAGRFPAIRYNMGLYYLQQHEGGAAVSCFNQYREETHSTAPDELIAQQYLSCGDDRKCIKTLKRSVLLDPASRARRAQLFVATQARCQRDLTHSRSALQSSHHLKKCLQFYRFFQQLPHSPNDSIAAKVNRTCREEEAEAARLLQTFEKRAEVEKTAQIEKEGESQDEQDKRLRQMKEKKQRALALAKIKNQDVGESWRSISEKQKAQTEKIDKEKNDKTDKTDKNKRRPPKDSDDPSPKRKERPKDKRDESARTESEDYYSVNNAKKEKVKEERGKRSKKEEAKSEDLREKEESLSKYMVE